MITTGGLAARFRPSEASPPEHVGEFVADDLDDHLPGRDRAEHVRADRFLRDRVDEAAHHRQRDIGLEQRDTDLAHRLAYIRLGQRPAPAQAVEDSAEPIGQIVEHRRLQTNQTRKTPADETSSASVASFNKKRDLNQNAISSDLGLAEAKMVGAGDPERSGLLAVSTEASEPAICSPPRGKRRRNGGA